jgi:hypothetical protein
MKFVLCEENIDGLTLPTVQFKATSLLRSESCAIGGGKRDIL